ncbi:hypothetical protein ES288_A11G229100v1 [Gossypium darwinii]|uniref:Uncharacterized protein n=1 Tax=Gossypium darwinii TaxID=34276 RepID=A0A5D2EP74_GOSDA|nr:hypothetical protein ES288_A11G229100v1 [Gossypium darwinii]
MQSPTLQLLENVAIENLYKYCFVGETAWIFVQPTTFKFSVLLNTITYILLYRRKSRRHPSLDICSCSFLFFD